jgi:hypothetical protein
MFVVVPLALTPAARRAFDRMAADGRRVLGARFVALVAYTPTHAALFAERITAADLDAFGPLAEVWHREGVATPLVLTPAEFRRSVDAFPVEYQAMLDRHQIIAGVDPFGDARVDGEDLRRACEVQAKAHLIHLREGWIEAGGHRAELADLAVRSAGPLRALLTHLARLHDLDTRDDAALAEAASGLAGVPADLTGAILALEDAPAQAAAFAPRMPEYLEACERLWAFIDRWRGR